MTSPKMDLKSLAERTDTPVAVPIPLALTERPTMLDTLRARRAEEDGFTLIELMVVVLIIAILVAIAIPTFLGARGKANDRAAQADIRNAFTAERTYYTDSQTYADKDQITAIENSLKYTDTASSALASTNTVMINVADGVQPGDTVTIATFSSSGHCFWLKDVAASGTQYGVNTTCGDESTVTYADTTDGWKY